MTLRETQDWLADQPKSAEMPQGLQNIRTETVAHIDNILSWDRLQLNQTDEKALTAMDLLQAQANKYAIFAMAATAANDDNYAQAA